MKTDKDMPRYMEAITERFRPAATIEEATHRFSTGEVCVAIERINPGTQISAADAYKAMKDAGFRFVAVPGIIGLQFKWILIEK